MTIALTTENLREMNKATFDAFVQSGKYAFSYNQACEQFGRVNIDILVNNKLLVNTSDILGKKRFLLSDIIAAFEAWKKM